MRQGFFSLSTEQTAMARRDCVKPMRLRAAAFLLALIAAGVAGAQTASPLDRSTRGPSQAFPARPVRIIVPQAPGGASDALARIIGQRLSERWRQQVVVDNRPGAGGVIGTDIVAKAAPDGYNLLLAYDGTHAINASLYKSLPFDTLKDFSTVATLANVPFVMAINPALPAKSVSEFIAYANANDGKVNYGSAGNGSANHLLGVMFSKGANLNLIHVPYKGAAPALTDLIGGTIQTVFTSMPSVVGFVQAGRVRALAVTSAKRSATLPNLPTIAEAAIPGFDVHPWFGLLAPARTPAAVVKQMNNDIAALIRTKDVADAFTAQGAEPFITTPEAFSQMLKRDIEKWAAVVRESGAKLD
jgi:tripartite-type tricarboxylate transporter receptor subunit TctC